MVTKSTKKAIFIATLNNQDVAFKTNKTHIIELERYIRNAVSAYSRELPPQTLKDYVIEEISNLGGTNIEIIENVKMCDIVVVA